MNTKSLISFLLFFSIVWMGQAQDLIHKVPAESNFLVTINNKAVFKHLDINDVNLTLTRLGLFNKIVQDKDIHIDKLQDFGVDFSSKAYFFGETTDSVQFVGGLIPLSDAQLFETLISDENAVEMVNGLKTFYSKDQTLRVSWDKHTVYILGGISIGHFFDTEEIRERYGLPAYSYDSYYDDYDEEYIEAADAYAEDWYTDYDTTEEVGLDSVYIDSLDFEAWDLYDTLISPPLLDTIDYEDLWGDYDIVDSILSKDEYQDDYYTHYREYTRQKDSIINELIHGWVDTRLNDIIAGRIVSFSANKGLEKLSDNTVADIKIRNIGAFYKAYYPMDILYAMGVGSTAKIPALNYGIEEVSGRVIVDRNKLLFAGDATVDKEMTPYYKAIYNRKINRKFLPFLDKETLGFMSFNINTEAYIKHLPVILEKYYGPLSGKYSDFVGLGTTFLDILLDEKAIAKVFKGDNLFVVNGVTQMEVTYTDYEYDDDFNYHQIEKTKTETLPQFLWMFSSDDMRLFTKLIDVGIRENGVEEMDGIYAIKKKEHDPLQVYVLMKDGIVFLGNDLTKLQDIKANRTSNKGSKMYANMVRKNNFALLFNTKKVPDLIEDLELPVNRSMEDVVQELSQYGDFYISSSGIKGNKLKAEMGIEFPGNKGNSLAFLFRILDRWLMEL